MRLEYFEYLMKIDHYKNMRIASEKLHMTPQALSICVKNMEQEVGFPIFIRKPKGVEFTAEGERLLECAERILEDYHGTLRKIYQEQEKYKERKKLIIYITPIMSVCIGRELIEYLQERYSFVTAHIINDVPEDILSRIEESGQKNADVIGLLTASEDGSSLAQYMSKNLEFVLGFSEDLLLATAKSSSLARQKSVKLSQLQGMTLLHCTSQKLEFTPSDNIFAPVKESLNNLHYSSIALWGKMIGDGFGVGPIIQRALKQAFIEKILDKKMITGVMIEGHPKLRSACIFNKEVTPLIKEIAQEIVNL